MTDKPFRVDVHHHLLPPVYVEALRRVGQDKSGGADLPPWSVEQDLALMDRQGIAAAVLSISSPGLYFGDLKFTRDLCRPCNEACADVVRQHPQRFGALALLPLPDVGASLQEIAFAADVLGMGGFILLSSYGPQYLGDPAFDPVLEELSRRQAVVLLHPTTPPGEDAARLGLPPALVDFLFDTTRAVANLIYKGAFERYPGIQWIVSHAGAAVPAQAGRLADMAALIPKADEIAPAGALAYLKRLNFDTASSATPFALRPLQELVPPSQVLFGSDYPYVPEPQIQATAEGLTAYDGFSEVERRLVERDNALRLFPRLAQVQ